ncbi:hypothetical protein OC834_004875 [Tilletia horrida]|nr:hypothetical protein OC834_004875 [Tilletia horrida]
MSYDVPSHGFVPQALPIQFFREHLPDSDLDGLRLFLRAYFHRPTSTAYLVQTIICTVFLSIILVAGSIVISYRLSTKTLWLFRVQDVRGTALVIPNSTSTFVFLEAAFGSVYLADVWHNLAINKWGADPALAGYWTGAVWILLFTGAWCGAWGTFFACPGILHRPTSARGFDARSLVPGPKMCNFIGLIVPVLYSAAGITICITTGSTYRRAVRGWRVWDARAEFASQSQQGLSDALKDEAAEVWKTVTDAWWLTSVNWLILVLFNWTFLVFYVLCGGFLIYTIYSQLQSMPPSAKSEGKSSAAPPNGADDDVVAELPRWNDSSKKHNNEVALRAADIEMTRAQASVFFPPLANRENRKSASMNSKCRTRMLSSALTNISLIYIAISLGCLGFAVSCTWSLQTQYQHAVDGPYELSEFYERAMVISSWLASAAGIPCFAAISQKTFEGVFEEWSAARVAQKRQSRPTESSPTLASKRSARSWLGCGPNPDLPQQALPGITVDPAHSLALQYFQSCDDPALTTDDEGPHRHRGDQAKPEALPYGQLLRPDRAARGPRARSRSTTPFDSCRVSYEDDKYTDPQISPSAMAMVALRRYPITVQSGAPRGDQHLVRPGSAASGITVRRAITTSIGGGGGADRRPSVVDSDGNDELIGGGTLRKKRRKPHQRSSSWQAKYAALHRSNSGSSGNGSGDAARRSSRRRHDFEEWQRLSREEVRQAYLDDDSLAGTDSEDNVQRVVSSDEEEDEDEDDDSGSVPRPLSRRNRRRCSSTSTVRPSALREGGPGEGEGVGVAAHASGASASSPPRSAPPGYPRLTSRSSSLRTPRAEQSPTQRNAPLEPDGAGSPVSGRSGSGAEWRLRAAMATGLGSPIALIDPRTDSRVRA